MKLDVLTIEGKSTGRSIELPEEVFGVEPNEHVLYLAVKQYLAGRRSGTHKAKERGEVSGSTRKLKRQKGTGTARAGDIKNPVFRGGGRIFGPRPRKYNIKLNKKVKRLARKSALSAKAAEGEVIVVEDFSFDAPRTKEFRNILKNLSADSVRSLFVLGEQDDTIQLSGRNLPNTEVVNVNSLNTYQVVKANKLILSEGSVGLFINSFGKTK